MRYKCKVCDSVNTSVKVQVTAGDNVPAEIKYHCNTCGEYAYFAYGHYENDRCMFELIEDCQTPTFGSI